MKKIKHYEIRKNNLPSVIKSDFGIDEQVTFGLMESVTLGGKVLADNKDPKVIIPKNTPKNLDISIIKPGEKTHLDFYQENDVKIHDSASVIGIRVEKPGAFRFIINHSYDNLNDDSVWNLHGVII